MCFGLTLNIIAQKIMFVNMFLMFVDNFFVLGIKIALAPITNEGYLILELFINDYAFPSKRSASVTLSR